MRLQARRHENGDLHVTVLIRNGSPKTINIPQLPLQMDIHLPGASLITTEDITLSSWGVSPFKQ